MDHARFCPAGNGRSAHPQQQQQRAMLEEKLWQEFFQDPSIWWDNRRAKRTAKNPDFKHASTGASLWMDSRTCPPWVAAQLTNLQQPSLDSSGRSYRALYKSGKQNAAAISATTITKQDDHEQEDPLSSYYKIRDQGSASKPRIALVLAALKACRSSKDLESARGIHKDVMNNGDISNVFLANMLVDVYAKCGSMIEARQVFDKIRQRTVVSWNSIILGYANSLGQGELALQLYQQMQKEDDRCQPNNVTVLAALRACSSLLDDQGGSNLQSCLERGRLIHSQAAESRIDEEIFVANSLIDMYSKCGSMTEARAVFDKIQKQKRASVVSWNCIMMGYAQAGRGDLALEIYGRMKQERCKPNRVTFLAALKACGSLGEKEQLPSRKLAILQQGRLLHRSVAAREQIQLDLVLGTALVDMYCKCGSLADARQVFEAMKARDAVLWTALILGSVQNGEAETGLEFYSRMQEQGCFPDRITVLAALKACGSLAEMRKGSEAARLRCLSEGRLIHSQAQAGRLKLDLFAENAVLDMYVKCRSMNDALAVFERLDRKDVVSWTVMIQGFAEGGRADVAMEFFQRMEDEGCCGDDVTFVAAFNACAGLGLKEEGVVKEKALESGRAVRAKAGKELSLFVANAAIDMFAKCGSLAEALEIFDRMRVKDVVSWSSVIQGCAEAGQGELALRFMEWMRDGSGGAVQPNRVTILAALKACVGLAEAEEGEIVDGRVLKVGSLQRGREVHRLAAEVGEERDLFVGNCLLDFYGKCGAMDDASQVFEEMRIKDVVSWTAMIRGFVEAAEGEIAMDLFSRMRDQGCRADDVTYAAVLKACGGMGAIEAGRALHEEICSAGFEIREIVANSLVDFYGKCGIMAEAQQIFDRIDKKSVVSWSSLIAGYSYQGDAANALNIFERMQEQRVQPNAITYLAVLAACSHGGLVEQGKRFLQEMFFKHGIVPGIQHHTCVVDLLGRANRLDEAVALVEAMASGAPDAVIWMALLGAAEKFNNLGVARRAFEAVLRIDKGQHRNSCRSAAYVLISNVYAAAGMKLDLQV